MPERPKRKPRAGAPDALTGLAGRAEGQARLEAALAAAEAGAGAPVVAVVMLDLERLRAVNAALGYAVGDRVLQEVARRLVRHCGPLDGVARFGSDDFLVVLPRSDRETALAAASALCDRVCGDLEVGGLLLRVRTRLGVALHPEHGHDAATLLRRADLALAEARERQADSAVYRAGEDERQRRRHVIGQSLRAAPAASQLHLEYQPKLELPSRRVIQAEALLRWRHPELGLVPPDEFIPIAESSGEIHGLTRFVLGEVLRQMQDWRSRGLEAGVAVNLSALDLSALDLPAVVDGLLRRHDVAAGRLTLEITESAVMRDPAASEGVLQALRALGVRVALDDFGVGHSSFSRLRRLPVDELKLDRSFVSSLGAEGIDARLVRALIELGHGIGARVVAEGVEDVPTLRLLEAFGCDVAQGWAVSAPLAADAFEGFCRARRARPRRGPLQPAAVSTRSASA